MRFRFMLACVAVSLGLGAAGCSDEEPPAPSEKAPKVVRKIAEPPAEPVEETPKKLREDRDRQAAPGAEIRTEVSPVIESPGTLQEGKALSAPVPAETENIPRANATEATTVSPEEGAQDSQPEERGVYTVKPGDCLAVIAGREDVFGDPLKWTLLYQFNRDVLEDMRMDEFLPEQPLPQGIRLRFTQSEEARARGQEIPDAVWVVNLISSPTADRIDGPAVELMKRGYPVYISRATVKGQKWMRLRVGFFQNRSEAVKTGKELQKILDLEDSWPVRIGPEETAEYAELLMPLHKG